METHHSALRGQVIRLQVATVLEGDDGADQGQSYEKLFGEHDGGMDDDDDYCRVEIEVLIELWEKDAVRSAGALWLQHSITVTTELLILAPCASFDECILYQGAVYTSE